MTPQEVDYALHRLNDRLKRVEEHIGLRQPAPAAPETSEPKPDQAPNPTVAPVAPSSIRQSVHMETASAPAQPGNWLGLAAVVCFVLAAAFIVRLSIESGWLTPARQIGLAALFGVSLIGGGLFLRQTDREYANWLPAAGIIVLYLTTFAAHGLYKLFSFDVGIAMVVAVSMACIWLYIVFRHDLYAITAAVGAYLAPAILGLNQEAEFSLYYFMCCSVAFATISIWLHTRTLTVVATYLALVMTAAMGMELKDNGLVAGVLAVHFIVFTAGTWLYTRESKTALTETECWSLLPVLIAFYALEYYFLYGLDPDLAPWISLAFAGVLIALYLTARKFTPPNSGSQLLVLSYATVVACHSVYLELLPESVRPWLLVGLALATAFSPERQGSLRTLGALWVPVAAGLAISALEYLKLLSGLLMDGDEYTLIAAFSAFASLWVVILRGDRWRGRTVWSYGILGLAHLLAILGFYRLTADAGSLAVSASWLVYAIAVMVFAFTRKDETMAKSALAILALSAGKALLYDASSAPTLVRIFCLLLTGAVLYGCGLLMRKIAVWNTKD
jgi:uncharacterized membrane protein